MIIEWPYAPLKPIWTTIPSEIEYIEEPSWAAISIPEWFEEAPEVGEVLYPKLDVILW